MIGSGGEGCEGRVGYMRVSGRRRKESGAEGCGVERRDAIVVYGERRGSESREKEGRIG